MAKKTIKNAETSLDETSLEQNIAQLEQIAKQIEGEISINEIVSVYKTANQIIQKCKNDINAIENSIIEINSQNKSL
jgi:exodeoxyribonuclease VII small subunit